MEVIVVGLLALCCGLAIVAMVAAIKLRNTVDATLRGGTEQSGTLRGDLAEAKRLILDLDSRVGTMNQKIAEHQKAMLDMRTVVDELRALIKPEVAKKEG